jgi:hypothetical protein
MVNNVIRTSCAAALLAVLLTAGTASAQDASQARQLFEQGVSAAASQRWTEAIDAFTRSFAIVERASTAYNLAVALGRVDRVRDALGALEDYFRLANASDSGEAERHQQATELRTRLEGRVARLTLTVAPEDATVEIDGTAVEGSGATRELTMDPGAHVIRVVSGDDSEEVSVTLAAGEAATRSVSLGGGAVDTPPPAQPAARGGDPLGMLGIVGIAIAGVGVAAGAAAIGTGVASNDIYNGLIERCGPDHDACPPGSEGDISTGSSLAWASTALTIVAGVAVAAGVTLFAIDLADGSGSERAQLEITPGPTLAGLGGRVRY